MEKSVSGSEQRELTAETGQNLLRPQFCTWWATCVPVLSLFGAFVPVVSLVCPFFAPVMLAYVRCVFSLHLTCRS